MKINEVTIDENDTLIFTIGDLGEHIFPTKKDLIDWKKLLKDIQKGNSMVIVPPIVDLTVIHNNRKPKGK
jgi:hypothetical protein